MSSIRENSIIIDWLSITSKKHTPEELIFLLGMNDCTWQTLSGMHGYQERLWYDSISIHYAGRSDMGVWLEMSGQGCRAFETYGNGCYETLFSLVLSDPDVIHITRLDVAFDEYTSILDISRLCKDTLAENYRSKMTYYEVTQSSNGQSLQIGSNQSNVVIRIYDKLAERLSKFKNDDDKEKIREEIPHWIRVELQMRDDRALEFIRLLDSMEIGSAYTGVIRNYLQYGYSRVVDGEERFCLYSYWEKILQGAEAISIYRSPGTDYNLARCQNYVFNSAGNAVDALLQIHGTDMFLKLLSQRKISNNPKYLNLISKYKDNNGCLKKGKDAGRSGS